MFTLASFYWTIQHIYTARIPASGKNAIYHARKVSCSMFLLGFCPLFYIFIGIRFVPNNNLYLPSFSPSPPISFLFFNDTVKISVSV